MTDLTSQPWFRWALVVVIGLPVALIALTELHAALVRRGSPLARPVSLLRNVALPTGVLLLLLTQTSDISTDETWVQIIATVFGVVVMLLVLSSLNVALFSYAAEGSWRQRLPSIFVDIGRIILIGVGLAILFSWVWGANVGGLFAALGVTSIVLGLALQNAVGSIISGLLLLFEQPFTLGDWLDAGGVRGRVVEVNWRAVHIDTGNGIQIMPNAALAGSSFTNLSQPTGAHIVSANTAFAAEDPPDAVCALLDRVAADLVLLRPGSQPRTIVTGPKTYRTSLPLRSPADTDDVLATFLRWTWYASRRAGLHLDGATDDFSTAERVEVALRSVARGLHLTESEIPELAGRMQLQRYGAGERIFSVGAIPDALRFVIAGRVSLSMPTTGGGNVPFDQVGPGDRFGVTALTREGNLANAFAVDELSVLRVAVDVVDGLVRDRPALARELGQEIDLRRQRAQEAIAGLKAPRGVPVAPT